MSEPRPFDLDWLLEAERARPVPDGVRERVFGRLQSTIAPLAALSAASTAGTAAKVAATGGAATKVAAGVGAGAVKVALGVAVAAVAAGGVVRVVRHRTPPPPIAAPAPAPRTTLPEQPPEVAAPPAPVPKPSPRPPLAEPTAQLGIERDLIERARSALARRQLAAAEAALVEHERRFPAGLLAEEREALRVRRWLASGDSRRAVEAAEAFRRRYPGSLLLPDAPWPSPFVPRPTKP